MTIFIIIVVLLLGTAYVFKSKKIKKHSNTQNDTFTEETQSKITDYTNAYERKYLMTLNEKDQFKKIKEWADKNGFIVFTKVRLLDLVTPRKDIENPKGALWKIQAKHVDFIICDNAIRVKCIIEIDDNSHKQPNRIERDVFVSEVLIACGYKVLQTYNVTDEQLNRICNITSQPEKHPQDLDA